MDFDGKRLKLLRVSRGPAFTQEYVAAALDVSLGAYRNWEQGLRTPDTESLLKLSKYYDVTLDFLLGLTHKPDSNKNSGGSLEPLYNNVPIMENMDSGASIYSTKYIAGYIGLPKTWEVDFAIQTSGSLPLGGISSFDTLALCRDCVDAEDGAIVVCIIDEMDTLIRRVKLYDSTLVLRSLRGDKEYVFVGKEKERVRILGRVVKLVASLPARELGDTTYMNSAERQELEDLLWQEHREWLEESEKEDA